MVGVQAKQFSGRNITVPASCHVTVLFVRLWFSDGRARNIHFCLPQDLSTSVYNLEKSKTCRYFWQFLIFSHY